MAQPLCPYFGKCGGCAAQHIDYAFQLENKQKTVAKAAGVEVKNVKVFSGNDYHYRNRMDFIFHSSGIGLREKGNWRGIVDVEKCVISDEGLNKLVTEVRGFFKGCDYFDVLKKTGTFRYAVIRTPHEDSSISFVLNKDSGKLSAAIEKVREFAAQTSAKNVIVTYVPASTDGSISEEFFVVTGSDFLHEEYLGKKFKYHVQAFFQNNHAMAEKMLAYSRELLMRYDTSNAQLLDLYGGVGSFGIVNSDLFRSVLVVESVKGAIDAANENIKENKCMNVAAEVLDAKNVNKLNLSRNLFVINDPPRSGMHPKAIERLNELKPKVILYVSCNPEQLGKELPKFKNYTLKSVALFDLFPQTPHIEAVAELVLKEEAKN